MATTPRRPPSPLRSRVEKVSFPLLAKIHALPRLVVPLATLVLVAVGAFAPLPVALLALAMVLVFIAWIAYLSWPVVPPAARLLRVVMVALLIGLAASRF